MRVMIQPDGCRNKRSVWTIATQAFPEAHFATFPEELAETCIKAGSSERGCCAACGAPWERIVERVPMVMDHLGPKSGGYGVRTTDNISGTMSTPAEARTTGWKPGCECGGYRVRTVESERLSRSPWYRQHWYGRLIAKWGDPVPCVVADPFSGAGTTGLVCAKLGRDYIGCELNPEYAAMSKRRLDDYAPLFGVLAEVA